MLAKGNGDPAQCVQNLIQITRGTVPFERLKGIDETLIDRPSTTAAPELAADIDWLIRTYEPRVSLSGAELEALTAEAGSYRLAVEVTNK